MMQKFDTVTGFNAVSFLDMNNGYIVGQQNNLGGVVFKTTNAGSSWIGSVTERFSSNQSVSFVNTMTGFIGTSNGGILKTTDAGTTWNKMFLTNSSPLNSLVFVDTLNGFSVGREYNFTTSAYQGIIKKSTDGGKSWKIQFDSLKELQSIFFLNTQIGYSVGDNGIILKTNNAGTTGVSKNEIFPVEFTLKQNYPNPFNPSTTIEFSIPFSGFVSLKIFNSLGQEISSLISQKLDRGDHSIVWDAKSFVSGVYFYRLQSGNFYDIKKLVLLR